MQSQIVGSSSRAAEAMRKSLSGPKGDAGASGMPPESQKKPRTEAGSGSRPATPSLLSRLNASGPPPAREVHGLPPKPQLQIRGIGRKEQRLPSPEPGTDTVGGLSIKGAARAMNPKSEGIVPNARSSLLDRLSGSGDTLAGRIDGDSNGRRRRKKGKGV
ncbi:hypothetical protein OE88DRAFT_1208629 [Heliocybe sulcata]|uniref:Uncharacterized protein n=1 Tax=Heliocybe sulcata TaxID=5364 RepID=A0A5C3NDM3_9AGAM|nr:hypothetical protein OE88DRAFT_1208629 [Heliocybe sulcata]